MSKVRNALKVDASQLALVFKVFGDKTRIRVVCELLGGEKTVSQISKAIQMSQPSVSQHLRVLRTAGMVAFRREGKLVHYAIADDCVKMLLDAGMSCVKENNNERSR